MLCIYDCGDNVHHEYTSRIKRNFGGFKSGLYKYISTQYILFDKYSRNRFSFISFQVGFVVMLADKRSS